MITRQDYMNAPWKENKDERHAAFVAYYAQFITPTVTARLTAFLQSGGNINMLAQVDRLANAAPADVNRLMREAGDYPTLAGLVCLYKVAYELQQHAEENT